MALVDTQLLTDFFRRSPALLLRHTTAHLAQQLSGRASGSDYQILLHRARKRMLSDACTLTLTERVEVAAFFMGLSGEPVPVGLPPLLSFVLQQRQPKVIVKASVTLNADTLLSLKIYRASKEVGKTTAVSLSFTDALPVLTPGVRYKAVATYETAAQQTKDLFVEAIPTLYFGCVPATQLTEEQVAALTTAEVEQKNRLTFESPERQARMFVFVPAAAGTLVKIENEGFGTTNVLETFQSIPFTLGEQPGTLWSSIRTIRAAEYQLLFTLSSPTL
jgi:hypothetical protein